MKYMFAEDIKRLTKENTYFRKVLYTGRSSQLVVMNIAVGEDIGEEVHPDTDQILFIVDGEGEATLNGEVKKVEEDDVIFVPAGTTHNLKNTNDEGLKLFTIYSPPEHPDGTIHKTKKEAEESEHE